MSWTMTWKFKNTVKIHGDHRKLIMKADRSVDAFESVIQIRVI